MPHTWLDELYSTILQSDAGLSSLHRTPDMDNSCFQPTLSAGTSDSYVAFSNHALVAYLDNMKLIYILEIVQPGDLFSALYRQKRPSSQPWCK